MLSLKSESGVFNSFQATWLRMLLYVFWKMKNYLCTKKMLKAIRQILKRQFGENNICWEVIFFQAEAWMSYILCEGNIPVSGLMQPNCRNWFPATTLGMLFWVWFDLWRLPWETVSISCSLLKVIMLCQINLSTLSPAKFFFIFELNIKTFKVDLIIIDDA